MGHWALIEQSNGYDLVYGWFDYLKKQNYRIAGYVIMPTHLHALIDFSTTAKKINTIIGDGKRFMAYEIVKRLKEAGKTDMLEALEKAVATKRKEKGKLHEIWEESFDWKICETAEFAYQKLIYMHNNPCSGKWKLVEDITKYEHSSARYYITGKYVRSPCYHTMHRHGRLRTETSNRATNNRAYRIHEENIFLLEHDGD